MKPEGSRRLQLVVNEFFDWLRASQLETNRVAYWWANRMLIPPAPLGASNTYGRFALELPTRPR